MKNKTLLVTALLISSVAFGQLETYITETGGVNDPVIYNDQNNQYMPPCGENNDSNAFENGKSCTHNFNRIVANDFIVNGGETLTLETILVNVFIGATGSGVNASMMDIYYYSDNNGEPGSVIGGEFGSFISSQSVIGSNFGFDVWEIELDVTDRVFQDAGGSDKRYWIGLSIEATDSSNLFWENSTLGLNGSGEAYDDGSGSFEIDSALEGVYVFTGDCVPRLGVNDNFADQVQLYPNPVTDGIVTISTPTSEEIQVAIFDVLGRKVIETIVGTDRQLNVAALGGGVYLLQLTQNKVTATKKLVVK